MRDTEFFLTKYDPVTTGFYFIEISLDELVQVLDDREEYINQKMGEGFISTKQFINGNFANKLDLLLPLISPVSGKTLISETKSNWIFYTVNSFSGGVSSHEPDYLGEKLGLRVIRLVMVKDVRAGQPGSVQFSIRDWRSGTKISRVISAHKESRWEWDEYGEQLPFEEVERYTEKKIKDRLTFDMVERYCKNFGIDLFNPDFYSGRGCIINSYTPPNSRYMDKYPNQ